MATRTQQQRRRAAIEETLYDVVIAGGSLAGCTAAIMFARRGASVALIERRSDPSAYKVTCTHAIQPSATPTIKRLGLESLLAASGAVRNDFEVWTRWGWIRRPRDAGDRDEHGYNIRRQTLDPLIRCYASGMAGVDFMPGEHVVDLLRDGGRTTGVVIERRDASRREVRGRLVVGADGAGSHVAQLAGVPAKVKPNNRFTYLAYYEGLPLHSAGNGLVWFLDPDVAFAFENEDGLTLLACALTKNKLSDFKRDPDRNFVRFFEALPDGPPIQQAKRVSKLLGKLDMPNASRRPAGNGLALIGDAAMTNDPTFGVGCGFAFQSAEWLVECTAEALLADGDLDQALKRYRRRHRASLGGHHRMISDYSSGRRFRAVERLFLSAAAKDPKLARTFFDVGSRKVRPSEALQPRIFFRAVWPNVRRWCLDQGMADRDPTRRSRHRGPSRSHEARG